VELRAAALYDVNNPGSVGNPTDRDRLLEERA
jgi:hypothetical protein